MKSSSLHLKKFRSLPFVSLGMMICLPFCVVQWGCWAFRSHFVCWNSELVYLLTGCLSLGTFSLMPLSVSTNRDTFKLLFLHFPFIFECIHTVSPGLSSGTVQIELLDNFVCISGDVWYELGSFGDSYQLCCWWWMIQIIPFLIP